MVSWYRGIVEYKLDFTVVVKSPQPAVVGRAVVRRWKDAFCCCADAIRMEEQLLDEDLVRDEIGREERENADEKDAFCCCADAIRMEELLLDEDLVRDEIGREERENADGTVSMTVLLLHPYTLTPLHSYTTPLHCGRITSMVYSLAPCQVLSFDRASTLAANA